MCDKKFTEYEKRVFWFLKHVRQIRGYVIIFNIYIFFLSQNSSFKVFKRFFRFSHFSLQWSRDYLVGSPFKPRLYSLQFVVDLLHSLLYNKSKPHGAEATVSRKHTIGGFRGKQGGHVSQDAKVALCFVVPMQCIEGKREPIVHAKLARQQLSDSWLHSLHNLLLRSVQKWVTINN